MLLFVLAAPLAAQTSGVPNATPRSDAVAEEAISQLRSPYCPGLMLEICPSPQAALLRDSIYERAAQGESADEIIEWMIARHGEEWRGVPKHEGTGLLAWIIPPVALLLGAGVLAMRLRHLRSPEEVEPAGASGLSADERDQVAAALRQWEEG
jgi:cytochrome c-type biogenesis protein CcmH